MMTARDAVNSYQFDRARGASPVGLVVLLYDAAIESLRLAKAAAEEGRIEPRVASSNHVLLVINELSRSLDHRRGGDVARNLDAFYSVARSRLMEANLRADPAVFAELIDMFCSLREAWQRVEIDLAGRTGDTSQAASPAAMATGGETSTAGWSA